MLNKPDADTTIMLLIRHGATAANLQRPYILQGRTLNGPLSEQGISQVSRARDFLKSFPLDACFASPMRRAVESAELIAEPHGLPVSTIKEIEEVHVGDWESKSWEVIMKEDPQEYEEFMADPAIVPYKKGESYKDVQERVVPAFYELAQANVGKMISVVAHNVVNRSFLASLMGLDLRKAKDIKQNNACINVIVYRDNEMKVVTMNGVFHLGET